MAKPTNRQEFKENCLRRLGWPVIDINVDDDQVEDRIDEALEYYFEFHNEGTHLVYVSHQLTANDITNQYVTLDDDVYGISKVLSMSDTNNIGGMWDIRYQWRLNDFYNFASAATNMNYYTTTMTHLQQMSEVLKGLTPLEFNRHMDRVYVFMDWENDVTANDWIVFEGQQITDPEVYTDVWTDQILQELCSELIKKQWGTNMKKYQGVQLIGGVEMNGQTLYEEAEAKIEVLKDRIRKVYEEPPYFITG